MLDTFSYINRSTKSRNSFYKFLAMPSDDVHSPRGASGPHGSKAIVAVGAVYRRATSTAIPGALALSSMADPRELVEPEPPPEEHPYIARHRSWEAGREEREADKIARRTAFLERREEAAEGWRRYEAVARYTQEERQKFVATNLGFG